MTLNKCLFCRGENDESFRSTVNFCVELRSHTNIPRPVTHQPDRRPCPQKRRRARRISLAARLDRWGHDELRCKKQTPRIKLTSCPTLFFSHFFLTLNASPSRGEQID